MGRREERDGLNWCGREGGRKDLMLRNIFGKKGPEEAFLFLEFGLYQIEMGFKQG